MHIMGVSVADFLAMAMFLSVILALLLFISRSFHEVSKEDAKAMSTESPYDIFVLPDGFEGGWAYRHWYEWKYEGEDIDVIAIVPVGSEFYDLIHLLLAERYCDCS